MIRYNNSFRWFLAWTCTIMAPLTAQAGWFGLRNDLDHMVVVQERGVGAAGHRSGVPQRLYPGEAMHDGQPGRSARCITIFDPNQPERPLYSGPVPATADDLFLSIQQTPGGAVRLVPIAPTTVRAIKPR